MSNALEIRGLKKVLGSFTLGFLDLTVPVGAIYGFVGPNGAGKTTTIDLILGMGHTDTGTIRVLGFDHQKDELAVKQRVGYVSPELSYQRWGRVRSAIAFVKGFYPSWDDLYCTHLMRALDIDPAARIATLSFGTRIKLNLVLALSWRPALLILDEPTVGLDAISKRQIFAELLAAVRDGERTVFISSHGITDLERFADHVGMIKQGKLVFEGATADVVERYRMVDLIADGPLDIPDEPGFVLQQHEANRWRLLLDTRTASFSRIRGRGVQQVADMPVSLEDLFVALGRS